MMKEVILSVLLCFLFISVQAQRPPGGGCGPDDEDEPGVICDDEPIPLDDHVHWLAAGGAVIGYLCLNSKRRKMEECEV